MFNLPVPAADDQDGVQPRGIKGSKTGALIGVGPVAKAISLLQGGRPDIPMDDALCSVSMHRPVLLLLTQQDCVFATFLASFHLIVPLSLRSWDTHVM